MPPKLKTTVPPDAMAAQPDTPPDEIPPETQCMAEPEAPPKKKRGRAKAKAKASSPAKTKKGRPSKASVVTNEIAKNILVHPDVVQKVLGALETVAVDTLNKNGVFRLNFITAKIHTREAREATSKNVCGRDVALKPRPARRALKVLPSKTFKQLVV
jgi:hypothetical protein